MASESNPSTSATATASPAIPMLSWKQLLRHNDILMSLAVVMVVGMLLIPLPAAVLDVLLTINIALSITTMLVTLYTTEPLQYSTFPTVLLFATLFRLGLNVSSTRLILSSGSAGTVIESFGHFVIGGNFVVGLLIFIILIVINFIVITNGAGRVSEVAARFTLDAMPGKQLSIDADLNAGQINEEQARARRKNIQREADFYGTMDGASKFVKGDAVAAVIITAVNIIGGLVIGVLQMKMPIAEAASTFTILTVGEGLVSQIPALIISTATAILVTRVTADDDSSLGADIGGQMFKNAKILGIVGALMGTMALIPGMPTMPFLLLAGLMGGGSYLQYNAKKAAEAKQVADGDQLVLEAKQKEAKKKDNVLELLTVEPLELEIGYRLVPLIEAENGGDLLERIAQIRRQVASELGFVLPSIRVRDNLQLQPNEYHLNLRGVTLDKGTLQPDMWLAMVTDPELAEPIPNAIETKEPAFGLDALWVLNEYKEFAETNGYTVVSASAVASTHITELMKRHSYDILGHADVQALLDHLKETHEPLVTGLIPDELSVAELHRVLQNLLMEQVSIRDLATILEALSYHTRVKKDLTYLTEQCRVALSRSICKQHLNPETGQLPAITLAPDLEEKLAHGLMDDGSIVVSPSLTQQLIQSISKQVQTIIQQSGFQPVVLCSAQLRLGIRRVLERALPQIAVLSYNEIGPSVRVQSLATIRIEANTGPGMTMPPQPGMSPQAAMSR
ncbi:MAG: flagellar biosynthesis protein FlhA [Vampirovibrionales bacterium]|nr:flagellar biosynthesis protein FlhA [Vampirovibrionales bacterium]